MVAVDFLTRADAEAYFWVGEYAKFGMVLSQAERLAFDASCDRHAVRDALEHGCSADLAFLIWSD